MKHTIAVTQEHIDKAVELCSDDKNMHSECCPISLAARESLDNQEITTGLNKLCLGQSALYVMLPQEVIRFIEKFDNYIIFELDKPEPITFDIEL